MATVLEMNALIMQRAFPEFSWQPLHTFAFQFGSLAAQMLTTRSVRSRAEKLYGREMLRLQTAADGVRNAAPGAMPVRTCLVDEPAYSAELKAKVMEAKEDGDQVREDHADLRRELKGELAREGVTPAGAPPVAVVPPAAAAAAGGALSKLLGVTLDSDKMCKFNAEWKKAYGGKCVYQALAGTCSPKPGSTCKLDHSLSHSADALAWAQAAAAQL